MNRIKEALAPTGLPFAAYAWKHDPDGDWGVYSLVDENRFHCDNTRGEFALNAQVDFFTRSDGEAVRKAIRNALTSARIKNRLALVLYDAETGFLHLQWEVVLYGDD